MTATRELSIRVFETRDIPRIAWGVKTYLPELPVYRNIEIDEEWLAYLLHRYYGQPKTFQSWVLVDEDDVVHGGGAGIASIGFFIKRPVVMDVFLFVEKEYRSIFNARKLLRAYREWAMTLDPIIVTASVSGGYRPDAIGAMLQREGYQEAGKTYQLRTDVERL